MQPQAETASVGARAGVVNFADRVMPWINLRSFQKHHLPEAIALAALILALVAPALHAEDLPNFEPKQLVLYSDVVLLGSEVSATDLRVEKVLAGKWQGKQIRVPGLAAFRKQPGPFSSSERPVKLTKRCVVFLKIRHGQAGITANGVFRIQQNGSVLGYAQDRNPGGYELQAKPDYPSLAALLKAIAAAEARVPRTKEALLRKIAAETQFDDLNSDLHELLLITRPGDKTVVQFVTSQLARGGKNAQLFVRFLQNLHDPAAYPPLRDYFQRTGDLSVLYNIASQGSPQAIAFLAGLAGKEGKAERRRFALDALSRLYAAVESAHDTRAKIKAREAIITLFDKDPFVVNYTASHPRFLGVIAHPEAIQRLERVLARVRGDGTNREYQVARVLAECRRKLAQQLQGR